MPDLLETIVAATRRIVTERARRRPAPLLESIVRDISKPRMKLREALLPASGWHVIAECKRRSPAKGLLRQNYDPARIATEYERSGATAISVLTEPAFFEGSLDHLRSVRAAVLLPVLRKDFVVDRYQLLEAREAGADAALLIVAALGETGLKDLLRDAAELELDALVEVHDQAELCLAIDVGADLIGVNSRNLRTLQVEPRTCFELIDRVPSRVVAVAESGIRSPDDLARLRTAGYRGFLIGERLMTAPDPGKALDELLSGGRSMAARAHDSHQ